MKVAVVGLGKIGLPLAVRYARSGARVTGCDANPVRVDEINAAQNPFPDEANLSDWLAEAVKEGTLDATTDTASAVAQADVAVVIVPLVAGDGGVPDFQFLDRAVGDVAKGAHEGLLVCFETTMPVGSTRRLGEKIPGARVAFSPERVYSGRIFKDLETYPKLVGGVDDKSADRAREFYAKMLPGAEVRVMHSAEAAEMAKLAETAYRDVNIAFANELARYAQVKGVDVQEVIDAANSQPFSHIHAPGAGVGGHCIPHYPHFLTGDFPEATVMPAARALNESQPAWVASLLEQRLGDLTGKNVLVMGLSYRAGVKEPTSSPGIAIVRSLSHGGATVFANDPLFTADEIASFGAKPATATLGTYDGIIVQAAHPEYEHVDWSSLRKGAVVVDGRNCVDRTAIEKAGAVYLGIGR